MEFWSESSSDSKSKDRPTGAEKERKKKRSTGSSRSAATSIGDITAKLASTDFLRDNNLKAERITAEGAVCRSTFRPDLDVYGSGWSRNLRYYTSENGIKHDTRYPAPGACFNCGGNHWRKKCPRAVPNRRASRQLN